jgi:hypothetical protein
VTKSEESYLANGRSIAGAVESQMFGKPCFKLDGKAFISFFQESMVFKLSGVTHSEALALTGSKLFDPSGKGRAMKQWVQVPFEHVDQWHRFSVAASKEAGK